MATTNWKVAIDLDKRFPYTYQSMQELILAIEAAHKHEGHVTWYGKDMEFVTRIEFKDKLKHVLMALASDALVTRQANAEEYYAALLNFLRLWFQVFPNWPEVVEYVCRHLESDPSASVISIDELLQTGN